MELFMKILLIFSGISMAVTYLVFLNIIRRNKANDVDNLFALNLFRVYGAYLNTRKLDGKKPGVLFYSHFLFILITLCLGYLFNGKTL